MTTKKTLIFLALALLLINCRQRPHKDIPNHPDWTSIKLPGWTLQVPKTFRDSSVQGIDSSPGYIYSVLDSIFLSYDSCEEMLWNGDCNFEKEVEKEKRHSIVEIYNKRFGVSHELSIDTIGDRVASIVTSTKVGKGVTNISIQDCATGASLGITGQDLTLEKQKIVLEIFKTIRMQNDK